LDRDGRLSAERGAAAAELLEVRRLDFDGLVVDHASTSLQAFGIAPPATVFQV